jgi:hypothetical protein
MVTWGAVHVGDLVRGADQRAWEVTERGRTSRWVAEGETAQFVLRHAGHGEVSIGRNLADPVDLMHRADHTEMAAAVGALLGKGFTIEVLGESTVVDQFASAVPEVKRDRWGRYLLPHPETGKEQAWTRVTTLARTLADTFGLEQWGKRMVAKGVAMRPDLIASASAASVDDKGTLDKVAEAAMETAGASSGRNLGTALHSFTERLDRGEPLRSLAAPPPLDKDLVAYAAALKAGGLTVEPGGIERIVVLPELGVAGTLDRIVKLRKGGRAIKDLKTAKDVSYSWLEIAIQEACYARAPYIWDPLAGAYERMPADVDKDRGLVLHLPVGQARAQVYGVNLIKGWAYAQMAAEVRAARSGAKSLAWLVEPDDPATLALHNVRRAESRERLAELWDSLNKRGLWSEEVNAAAHARMAELQQQPATV